MKRERSPKGYWMTWLLHPLRMMYWGFKLPPADSQEKS